MAKVWDISVEQARKMGVALAAALHQGGHLGKRDKPLSKEDLPAVAVALEHAINQHVNEVNDGQHVEPAAA